MDNPGFLNDDDDEYYFTPSTTPDQVSVSSSECAIEDPHDQIPMRPPPLPSLEKTQLTTGSKSPAVMVAAGSAHIGPTIHQMESIAGAATPGLPPAQVVHVHLCACSSVAADGQTRPRK